MNNGNALGFVVTGVGMWLLPILVPGWFSHLAVDGSSTRAIWVQLMGLVEFSTGVVFLAQNTAIPALVRWATVFRGRIATIAVAWRPAVVPVLAPFQHATQRSFTIAGGMAARMQSGEVDWTEPIIIPGSAPALLRSLSRAWKVRQPEFTADWRMVIDAAQASRPHSVAAAMFRNRPQHSFVHLTNPNVVDFAQLAHASAVARHSGEPGPLGEKIHRVARTSAPARTANGR